MSATIHIGGLSRTELSAELRSRGILLNAHAETLLAAPEFDGVTEPEVVSIVERSVGDLGFANGAPLSRILAAAESQGLALCPPTAGPYLRLAMDEQQSAPDSVLSSGRAPTGSLTVATRALSDDVDYPRGFYLRVIDGQSWLRGYRCDDEHIWSPGDRFAFCKASETTQ